MCEWLKQKHGFFHPDMEKWPPRVPKHNWDKRDINASLKMLDTYGATIVLTWGFPPNCLQLVSRMKTAGIATIWIDAPLLFCRLHWRPEAGQDEATLPLKK